MVLCFRAIIIIVCVFDSTIVRGSNVSIPIPEKWSPGLGESSFEPSPSLLEQWTELGQPVFALEEDMFDDGMLRSTLADREDKVMKKPPTTPPNRIVNRPPSPSNTNKGQDVSETDMFLLGAIEKLVYRMDFLEKRVQRTEDMLYQILAGSTTSTGEPCPEGFSRQNGICYHTSTKQVNWKSASSSCRSMGGVLLELHTENDKKKFIAGIHTSSDKKGADFWTGGLNPGLLWLWGSSAKPVVANNTNANIPGSGRCLLLTYLPPTRSYQYKGTDCAEKHKYVCQMEDNTTERRLQRLLRDRKTKDLRLNFKGSR